MAKRDLRLVPGRHPLAYLGDNATSPPNVKSYDRAPTTDDRKNVIIGDFWINKSATPVDSYQLVALDAGSATWISVTSTFDGTLTDHGVVVADGTSTIKTIPVGLTGELLTGVTGSDPVFAATSDGNFSFQGTVVASSRLLSVKNFDNTDPASDAVLLLLSGGASGGDPAIWFTTGGVQDWNIGIDNSNSDKFTIAANAYIGPNVALRIDPSTLDVEIPASLTLSAEGAGVVQTDAAGLVSSSQDVDIASSLTLSAEGAGVVQTDAAGLVSSSAGTDGEVLVGVTSGAPAWQPLTYVTDSGTATTDNTGEIRVLGGTSVNVSASGNAITIDSEGGVASFFEPLASDPTDPGDGQVWYNTTTQAFKGAKAAGASAWVTHAVFPYSSHTIQIGASGTSEEALCTGVDGSTTGYSSLFEDLTDSWSNRSARNNLVRLGVLRGDTSDSALSCGGNTPSGGIPSYKTETYDGSGDSWTNKSDINNRRFYFGGAGDPSDALIFAGRTDTGTPLTQTNGTERYDGTGDSWTVKATLSGVRQDVGGTGSAADALCLGGVTGSGTLLDIVERYDGVGDSWSTKAVLSAIRGGPSGSGPAADALCIGGFILTPSNTKIVVTEIYDGALDSWSAGPNLNVARAYSGSTGSSSTDAITCDGSPSTSAIATEILESSPTIVTFTVT
jgi:hypothetical protein